MPNASSPNSAIRSSRGGADREGKLAIDLGVYGYPETFIVDANGIIRYRHAGPINKPDWEHTIRPIVQKLQAR